MSKLLLSQILWIVIGLPVIFSISYCYRNEELLIWVLWLIYMFVAYLLWYKYPSETATPPTVKNPPAGFSQRR